MLHYRVVPESPHGHLFGVTVSLDKVNGELIWRLPAWVPGSYMIRDFARNIVAISATVDDQPLALTKRDKHSWHTAAAQGRVCLTLQIHAHDPSVRAAFLDSQYGFFDGTSLFLLPDGHDDAPCKVDIVKPDGVAFNGWTLATGLVVDAVDAAGFGRYQAENYADLIDRPVLMGELAQFDFDVAGSRHSIALSGRQQADSARLSRDVAAICGTHAAMFGAMPMTDYTFLTRVTGAGFGGLEHRNSSALACARNTLPRRGEAATDVRDDYRTLLGLISHEYFHSWNVKRIRPAAFVPYDLNQEVHTELLWAFEGITSYYDNLALVRSGVIGVDSYLELLGQDMTRVARGHGRFKQSLAESSFDAWTRFYKQDASAPNVIVSYYVKGALMALALDLTLRELTQGTKSLDDVMRLLWQRYGRHAYGADASADSGVPENGVQAVAEEVAGQSLASFFQQAVYGNDDIDLAPSLEVLGVCLQWRSAASHADKGGKPAPDSLYLGALLAADSAGVKLRVLYEQGVAMQAGLAAGDVLIAVDGLRVNQSNLDEVLASYVPGERVRLHAFRGDELLSVEVTLAASAPEFAYLQVATGGLTAAGRAWLQLK